MLKLTAKDLETLCTALDRHFKVERFAHSINLTSGESDLRIRLQSDSRYQRFIPNARARKVLGYELMAAAVEDVLQGKIRAYTDQERRRSKRQKDPADIARLIETCPQLADEVPAEILEKLT